MDGHLGRTGAGKTTTHMLLGLHRPTSGRATLFGIDAWRDPVAAVLVGSSSYAADLAKQNPAVSCTASAITNADIVLAARRGGAMPEGV